VQLQVVIAQFTTIQQVMRTGEQTGDRQISRYYSPKIRNKFNCYY